MKLVTFAAPEPRPGALIGDEVLDFRATREAGAGLDWTYESIHDVLRVGAPALNLARNVVELVTTHSGVQELLRRRGMLRHLGQAKLLAPIPNPQLVVCAASNYRSHSAEMGGAIPPEPACFIKASGCVVGRDHPIVLPPEAPGMVDYEGELCVIIGRPAYRVAESEALRYVAGYCCGNDVSARDWVGRFHDWQKDPIGNHYESFLDPGTLNLRYKSFPTFMPLGPALVTADEVTDPQDLHLRTLVNGEVRQDINTEDMTYGVAQMIAHYSKVFAFSPGDVIVTGSPPGVGVARRPPLFLKAGDVVTVEIERLGQLTNPVVAADQLS